MTEKKQYESPEIKVHQVRPADIICTSGQYSTESLTNEEYQWNPE